MIGRTRLKVNGDLRFFSSVIRAVVFTVKNESSAKEGDVVDGRCHPSNASHESSHLAAESPFVKSIAALKISGCPNETAGATSSKNNQKISPVVKSILSALNKGHQLTGQSSGTLTDTWNYEPSILFK